MKPLIINDYIFKAIKLYYLHNTNFAHPTSYNILNFQLQLCNPFCKCSYTTWLLSRKLETDDVFFLFLPFSISSATRKNSTPSVRLF